MSASQGELHYLRSITNILDAIQGSQGVEAVIRAVSNAALEIFGCDRVFLLYPCDPDSPTFRVPYEATRPEYPGALELNFELPMTDENRGLFSALLELKKPMVIEPEEMERVQDEVAEFKETEFVMPKTAMVMSLAPELGKAWAFGLQQCSHVRKWTKLEEQLFVDIGQRLTDALSNQLLLKNVQSNEQKYRRLVESLQKDYFLYSHGVDGVFSYLSPSIKNVLGYEPEEFMTHYDVYLTDSPLNEKVVQYTEASLRGESSPPYLVEIKSKSGAIHLLEVTETPVFDDLGHVIAVEGLAHDVTIQHRATDELKLLASVFKNSAEGIVITDADTRIKQVNAAFCEITGYKEAEILGQTPTLFKSGQHDTAFYQQFWQTMNSEGVWQGEIWNRRKNGEIFPSWQTISRVLGDNGEVVQYISIFSDITDKKSAEERIRDLAYKDSLTELPNRQLFIERMQRAIARAERHDSQVALLFLDLDRFKHVNDSLGHPVGDALIKQVAERLLHCVRTEDTVARLGGDEFTLIIEGLESREQIVSVANKILGQFAQPFVIDGHRLHSAVSIGISLYPEHADNVDDLVQYADSSMYHAKERGGNQYGIYMPEMTSRAKEWVQLEGDLSQALTQKQLELYYQPQVCNKSGRVFGAEGLLRWNHPTLGMISPLKFIPMAEATGLIHPFGRFVVSEACRQLSEWLKAGIPLETISVNVSGQQLQSDSFVTFIEAQLEGYGLRPDQLELEITESYLMQHIVGEQNILNRLRELGVRLAIDDFGTGYSSLSRLKNLPLQKLKIDRSFVRDIVKDPNDEAIVKAIIALSESMQLAVLAEGVEEPEQLDILARYGCHQIQGYYFSRPLPANEFGDWWQGFSQQQPTIETAAD